MTRRIILTGGLLIIHDRDSTIRLILALLTSLFWLVLLISTYPFERLEFDILSIASSVVLTFIYVGALLVKLHSDFEVNFTAYVGARLTLEHVTATVAATLNFRKSETIVLLMNVFTVVVLCLVVSLFLQKACADRLAQQYRFRVEGGTLPELMLRSGHRWHLFLSHGKSAHAV